MQQITYLGLAATTAGLILELANLAAFYYLNSVHRGFMMAALQLAIEFGLKRIKAVTTTENYQAKGCLTDLVLWK